MNEANAIPTAAPEFYTAQELAARLRVTDETIRKLNPRLKPVRVGRQFRYPRERVEALLAGDQG
jgi:excisionase family DNA binding protein